MCYCDCLAPPERKPSQLSSWSAVLELLVLFELELCDSERVDDVVATPPGPTTRAYVLSAAPSRGGRGAPTRALFTPSSDVLDELAFDDVDTGTRADGDCAIAAAGRYGCSAASGTMTSRLASALMSVRPRLRG